MSSRHRTAGALGPAALLVFTAAAAAGGQTREARTLAGDAAAIYNLAGDVRVVSGTGEGIVIEIVRRGADGDQLRIATGRIGGTDALRILYPATRITYRPARGGSFRTTLHVREDGTFYDGGSDWRGDGRRVTIASSGSGFDGAADLIVRLPRGRRLSVFLAAGTLELTNVEGSLYGNLGAVDAVVTGLRGSLNLDTGSGEVRVRDADGDLTLDTGSGSVMLEKIRGRGLRIDSGSGAIDGSDIEVEQLDLDSGSGSVELANVRAADVRLDAGSGSVDLGLTRTIRDVRIDAGSGSVTLRLPADIGAELDISTGAGGIDTDFPLTVHTIGRDRLRGTLGDGKGRIEIDGGSGRIRLRKAP